MNSITNNRSSFIYFALVFALSIPFWILAAVSPDMTKVFPIKLPLSALMTFCPMLAAVILVNNYKGKKGVQQLFKLTTDCRKIKNKIWYIPLILLMPLISLLSFWYERITGSVIPGPQFSVLTILIFYIVYFIGAIGEELGWSGYIIIPLQNRYGSLKAGLITGFFWAAWHIIPFYQAHQTTNWIIWQCTATIFLRIIMVWLFNNAGKSVFAMVLFHAMINISPYLIPGYGPHYNPFIFTILLAFTAVLITYL